MAKEIDITKYAAGIAHFHFALIAPVIQRLYLDASAKAYYKRVTGNPLTRPNVSTVKYNYKTLEKWQSLYNSGDLEALIPSSKSDKGISCTLNDETITKIYHVKQEHPRKPQSREWLDDCFYNRITHKVRKDSTVTIDNVCYDVPMQFIFAKVDIRFIPGNEYSAFILFEDKKFPLHCTNWNENCHTKCNTLPSIDYSKVGGA